MISKVEARDLVRDLFEEEALVIGGLVAVHDVGDEVVWKLMKSLDVIRCKILRRLDDTDGEEEPARRAKLDPHPAIEEFLIHLQRDAQR